MKLPAMCFKYRPSCPVFRAGVHLQPLVVVSPASENFLSVYVVVRVASNRAPAVEGFPACRVCVCVVVAVHAV